MYISYISMLDVNSENVNRSLVFESISRRKERSPWTRILYYVLCKQLRLKIFTIIRICKWRFAEIFLPWPWTTKGTRLRNIFFLFYFFLSSFFCVFFFFFLSLFFISPPPPLPFFFLSFWPTKKKRTTTLLAKTRDAIYSEEHDREGSYSVFPSHVDRKPQ